MHFRKIPGRQLTHATENSTVEQNNRSGLRLTPRTEDKPTPDRLSINLFLNPHDRSAAYPAVLYNLHIASWSCFRSCNYRICIHFITSVLLQLDTWVLLPSKVCASVSILLWSMCGGVFFKSFTAAAWPKTRTERVLSQIWTLDDMLFVV